MFFSLSGAKLELEFGCVFVRLCAFFRGLGIGESRFRTMFCQSWHLSTAWVMLKADSFFTRGGVLSLASSLTSVSLFASPGPASNTVGCLDLSLRNLGKGKGGRGRGEGERGKGKGGRGKGGRGRGKGGGGRGKGEGGRGKGRGGKEVKPFVQ